jgi:hypothetical protein
MRTPNHVKIALASAFLCTVALLLFWLAPTNNIQAGLSTQTDVEPISQPAPMTTPPPCEETADAWLIAPKNGAKLIKRRVRLKWSTLPPLPSAETDECQVKFNVVVKEDSPLGPIRDAVDGLTNLEYTTIRLNRRTVYYWQVEAYNRDSSAFSESWWFKIKRRPPTSALKPN